MGETDIDRTAASIWSGSPLRRRQSLADPVGRVRLASEPTFVSYLDPRIANVPERAHSHDEDQASPQLIK